MTAAWTRILAFVPTRRAALAAVRARIRGLLDRVARVADGEGTRHLGLPRVLPPALRLGATALRAPALPDAADADRRRATARPRRGLAPRGRSSGCCTRPRSSPGARRRSTSAASPRSSRALLLLVYPAYATLYHQASSDAVFATGLAVWALLLTRALDRPSTARFVAVGAGLAVLVLVRPANQVLLPLARRRAARRLRRLAPPVRAGCRVRRRGGAAARGVGGAQRHPLRRRDGGARRTRLGAVPPGLHREQDDLARQRRGRRERLAELIEQEVLSRDPHASLGRHAGRVPAERVELRDGPPDRALRHGARARRELRRAVRLGARGDSRASRRLLPRRRRHVLGVPAAEAAARERRAARADGPRALRRRRSSRTASCSRTRRRPSSSSASRTASSGARPTTSTRARSPIRREVWSDPATQERYREIVVAGSGVGRRASPRGRA